MKSARFLITGFEPFGGESMNPSQILLQDFSGCGNVQICTLPVSYDRAWKKLEVLLDQDPSVDFLIMLGQAGGRSKVCLERVALNYVDSEQADEDGVTKLEQQIDRESPIAFLNPLSLRSLCQKVRELGVSCEVSTSAGAFVCNHLYYQSFLWKQKTNSRVIPLFVHVPYLPQQLIGKPAHAPSMELESQKKALIKVLETLHQWSADGAIK
jgi:pyroglutamyl-peptidase